MTEIKDVGGFLKQNGIVPSVQRIMIYSFLDSHRVHPSVDDIYVELKDKIPTLSKTTVYNTLKLFSEKKVCQMITINDSEVHFDAETVKHAHFLCKKCNKIYDFKVNDFSYDKLPEGFVVEEEHFYYKGICKDCVDN